VTYNPAIHHRRSIRLKGYDYTQCGAYFITLVTQGRESLFGHVVDDAMQLNDAGQMILRWWDELPNKFPTSFPKSPSSCPTISTVSSSSPVGRLMMRVLGRTSLE